MNSKLRDTLANAAKWLQEYHELETDLAKFEHPAEKEAFYSRHEKAIRQAVGEEMLGLKPNNPYKTTDGQVPESFEVPAHAYDVANGDWEQKIKEWQGGES